MAISKYDSTENLKITYFLGAGASYNSIPIWKGQGNSMITVANSILDLIQVNSVIRESGSPISDNKKLIDFFEALKKYGILATEYGSIDIYARRLYLINNLTELNELKKCLSVYFDIWENFLHRNVYLKKPDDQSLNNGKKFDKVDKRYFALLSILLEKRDAYPRLNDNISFLTWNYDLQLESAFESFMPEKLKSLDHIDEHLNFMSKESNSDRKEVLHLNGFRGQFFFSGKSYETVERKNCKTIEEYLLSFLENDTQFRSTDYNNSIKYSWESSSESIEVAKKIMGSTNILVIIGYSFPAFNRRLDSELIRTFENGSGIKEVVYQDPYANQDIVNSIFTKPEKVTLLTEDSSQFYIPHEFLFPKPGNEFFM